MLIDVKRKKFAKPTITTAKVRSSLQALVDGHLDKLGGWLRQTAEGIPKTDEAGKTIRDNQGSVVYVVKPDPKGAVGLVAELAEFVIPKLQRSDVQMAAKVESVTTIEGMSNRELSIALAAALGVGQVPEQPEQPEVIDAEFVMIEQGQQQEAALPDWLKPTPPESVR